MLHLPSLVTDLGLLLGLGAIVTLLFRKLKQPLVLGYIITGVFVGPHFTFFPTLEDTNSMKVWAEIGVIFLLFGLGLEFSFKKLAHVGMPASITALVEVIFMVIVGYGTGQLLGWSVMDSLFLGGILSISSTTIIIRAIEELNMKGRKFVSLVFGILIVEDIVAILLLVLLSTVAVTRSLSGYQLIESTGRLTFFLILWFIMGIYLLPLAFKKMQNLLTDEIMLIVAIGLCFLMVIVATHAGFSPALGAFVMGSLIAETNQGHRVEKLLLPVKDLFAAVFFISVGTMLDPGVVAEYGFEIAVISGVTILGKFYSTAFGALLSGRSLKHSMQTGLSLAQIGEFSFIIATLGLTLGVTSDFLYPIAVTVSALTSFSTPYLIKLADPIHAWVERRLPHRVKDLLLRYQKAVTIESSGGGLWSTLWKAFGARLFLNTIIIMAIGLTVKLFVIPRLIEALGRGPWIGAIAMLACFLAAAPFLSAVLFGRPPTTALALELVRLRRLAVGITVVRLGLGGSLIFYLLGTAIDLRSLGGFGVAGVLLVVLVMALLAAPAYRRMEKRFVSNLEASNHGKIREDRPTLAPWDATLAEFKVHPNSELVGHSLLDSKLKERFGITIGIIERGDRILLAPDRGTLLMPHDRLVIIGTDEQVLAARASIEDAKPDGGEKKLNGNFGLESFLLRPGSPYVGKPIRDCGIREDARGLIVGLERANQRILNPDSALVLKEGDLLWLVGEIASIHHLRT